MQTRVVVRVMHPVYPTMVRWEADQGARFRDDADIQRVVAKLTAEARRRFGEAAQVIVDTRET